MKERMKENHYFPYILTVGIYVIFVIFALVLDSPVNIVSGLWKITVSPSILITDYIEIGGIGAALVNAVIVGLSAMLLLSRSGISHNGYAVMAIWVSTGFAFFGKNVFNMIPITFGVWLYSEFRNKPFSNYALTSLLGGTLSPVVSEISFAGTVEYPKSIIYGIFLGIFVGFVLPVVSKHAIKAHGGYVLYNMGFAGGLLATFIVSVMRSLGAEAIPVIIWNQSYKFELAILMYIISFILIAAGIFLSGIKTGVEHLRDIVRCPGLSADYLMAFGTSAYINMGLLCALSTTVLLVFGGEINGPTIGGIFTIVGFGCVGKHMRNVPPIFIGAILSTYFNKWDPTSPTNTLAILFATALAPVAGDFGWIWGIVAGFVHVNMANHASTINSGLNLYNNGFAAGLVAMFLIPVIKMFTKAKSHKEEVKT